MKLKKPCCEHSIENHIINVVEDKEINEINNCLKLLEKDNITPFIYNNKKYLGEIKENTANHCLFYLSYGFKHYCTNHKKIKQYLISKKIIK